MFSICFTFFLQRFIWFYCFWCFRLSRGSSTYINLCKQMCRREYVAGAIAAPLLQVYHTCPWHQVKDQTSWLFFCGQTDWKKWTCCTTFYSNIFHKMFRLRITATRNSFARPQMQESLHFHELLISKMIEVYFGFFMPVNCCSDNKPDHNCTKRNATIRHRFCPIASSLPEKGRLKTQNHVFFLMDKNITIFQHLQPKLDACVIVNDSS